MIVIKINLIYDAVVDDATTDDVVDDVVAVAGPYDVDAIADDGAVADVAAHNIF